MLIDSHCHLHDRQFFSDDQAEKMLENAAKNGVKQIICIGTDPVDSLAARDFAESHPNVFWTYGIHPEEAKGENIESLSEKTLRRAERLAQKTDSGASKLVAIGEVGLDYHQSSHDRKAQIRLFEEMLELARQLELPVSFHVRDAFDDFFAVVQNFPGQTGVVHSFTDNKKNLKKVLENTDFFVGVNGLATYSTLPLPPLERILLETDAPFLTPVPFRGIINEPAYIKNIADWLSTKLGVSPETIAKETTKNVKRLFRLPDPL